MTISPTPVGIPPRVPVAASPVIPVSGRAAVVVNSTNLTGQSSFDSGSLEAIPYATYVIGFGPGDHANSAEWAAITITHGVQILGSNLVQSVAHEQYEIKTGNGVAGSGVPATLRGSLKGDRITIHVQSDAGTFSSAILEAALHTVPCTYDGQMRPNQAFTNMPSPPILGGGGSDLEIFSMNQTINNNTNQTGYCLPYSGPITLGAFTDAAANTMVIDVAPGHTGSPPVQPSPALRLPTDRSSWGPFYLPRRQCLVVATNTDTTSRLLGLSIFGTDLA